MTARTILVGFAWEVIGLGRALLAAAASILPSRHWQAFYRLPIRGMAWLSAIATLLAGLVVGGRGFLAYAGRAADAAAQAALDAAARQASGAPVTGEPITTLTPQMLSIVSVVAFTLFTPLGWLAAYLVVSGLLRVVAVATGHPFGDPLLTALDDLGRLVRHRSRASRARRRRAREEGPEAADRLFTGDGAGIAGADYAVVASRRKPGWSAGTIVVTSDGWYRVGEAFDAQLPYGLRTVYVLTRVDTSEVLRKAVSYELPPLQRGPGTLTRVRRPPTTPGS